MDAKIILNIVLNNRFPERKRENGLKPVSNNESQPNLAALYMKWIPWGESRRLRFTVIIKGMVVLKR